MLDLSDSILALCGTAFISTLTYRLWPKFALKIVRQSCRGIQITDIAISVWRGNKSASEFSVYIVWKKRK